MIQIDNRLGSRDMYPLLKRLGVEVELTRMVFGDVAFMGWAQNGEPVSVGLELKTLEDCIACIESGRFAGHQLPGLIQSYDHIWLVIAGSWYGRRSDGILVQKKWNRTTGKPYWTEAGGGRRRWLARDFESWLLSMSVLGGIRVQRVADYDEAALWIKTVYNWFIRGEHKSHNVVYSGKQLYADNALLSKPTLARRIAAELPGIGVKRSADVARQFHTLDEMVHASERDWMRVEGIGKGIAGKIYKAIHQNGNGK